MSRDPVTPTVTPDIEPDRKKALIEALRAMSTDDVLTVLAEVLEGMKA
ncbi:MAG: hypothetical protein HZB26_14045 [Candidatus Hydrogenedentes bacterium]|nr:hypothetical protein [Candidatus Hydrogenedentota bacterium]